MRTVLVTSSGCAPALAIAKALAATKAYRVVCMDSNPRSPSSFLQGVENVVCPPLDSDVYWPFVDDVLCSRNVECVFPTHANEILAWSMRAHGGLAKGARVFCNDPFVVGLCEDKRETFDWATRVGIAVPEETTTAPCVSRPTTGCGSEGVVVSRFADLSERSGTIVQRFVDGDEFTVDVLADPSGRVVVVVPKHRIRVKNGQAFESRVRMDSDVIEFASNVSEKLNNKSFINVQVIRERSTGIVYLVEINPRAPTSLPLTVKAGANVPAMMVESDFSPRGILDGVGMVRSYVEYFYVDV
jgi:carbamoyl-phosphate synthase large subunit